MDAYALSTLTDKSKEPSAYTACIETRKQGVWHQRVCRASREV